MMAMHYTLPVRLCPPVLLPGKPSTPVIVHREDPEVIARAIVAIRARRAAEAAQQEALRGHGEETWR